MTIAEIIEKLERATDRWSAISAFRAVATTIEVPEDFLRHASQAERSKSDSRAMGYLLLAALALVPYEHGLEIIFQDCRPSTPPMTYAHVTNRSGTEVLFSGWAKGRQYARAVLIAALRAREASDA